jgi:hypothetical protein
MTRTGICFLSDTHLEMRKPEFGKTLAQMVLNSSPPSAFMLILAGDIGYGEGRDNFFAALQASPVFSHVVYILGNHEYYTRSRTLREVLAYARSLQTKFPKLRVLENEILTSAEIPELGSSRILGSTLWSPITTSDATMMNDFNFIHTECSATYRKKLLTPAEYRQMHVVSVAWLDANIQPGDIVVTHHLPSTMCINKEKFGTSLQSAYASDLDDLISRTRPAHWVFGHSHNSGTWTIADTHLHTNCLGYQSEHTQFDMSRVIYMKDALTILKV